MEQLSPRPRTIPDNFVSPELSWKRWAERPLQEERRRPPKNRAVRRKPTQAEYRADEDIISERRVLERTRLFTGDGPKRYNFSREDFKSRRVRILRRMTGRPQEEVRAALIRARAWPGSWRDTEVSHHSPLLNLSRLAHKVACQPICVRYFWDDNGCLTDSLKIRDQINPRLLTSAVMAPTVEKEPRDHALPNGAGPHRRAPRRPDPSPKKPVPTPMKQAKQRRIGIARAVIHPGAISPIQRLPPVVVFLSVMRNVWRSR